MNIEHFIAWRKTHGPLKPFPKCCQARLYSPAVQCSIEYSLTVFVIVIVVVVGVIVVVIFVVVVGK